MVPLRPSRSPDSGGIFIFTNGVRMEKLSRFVRRAKQVKKNDAHCTCPYRTRGRTVQHAWHVHTGHVVISGCDTCHAVMGFSTYV
jgi:hypothetical protein